MAATHRIRYERNTSLLVWVGLLVACLTVAIALHQASSAALGPMRDTTDVQGCTVTHDPLTGREVRTGC